MQQPSNRPGADLYWLIAVALDSIQDPGGAFAKVLMQGGWGKGQHVPSSAATQGLQLCPQLAAKVANLLQGHVLHQVHINNAGDIQIGFINRRLLHNSIRCNLMEHCNDLSRGNSVALQAGLLGFTLVLSTVLAHQWFPHAHTGAPDILLWPQHVSYAA
ncbi:MAG: hypothetical protein FRX49_07466 [Trebouxia sp. A1-2]|nr:MAG: hypothetical protein FRX49_07466 [Trebouxia sp. A1-2]